MKILLVSLMLLGLMPEKGSAQNFDRAAFEAAAKKCGLPLPGQGRPTPEEESCMEQAGFPKPKGPPPHDLQAPDQQQRENSGF